MLNTTREIEAKDVKRLLLRLYKKYQSGEITENKAQKETFILNSIIKAIEVTDLEERLQNIESSLKRD
jgi:hypothetical protein